MPTNLGLSSLLDTRRVVLVVGCGGVGKTTTTAALGLAAARRGKRVLALTIDPARRLSQSLGLEQMTTEAQRVSPELFREQGVDVPGELTVMRVDTKTTFDGLVASLAPTPEKRDRVLGNVLYKYISTSLAGTQEYMAMEKLYAVKSDPAYDLILLDTPPTTNALDFLDAPERLVGAIDSAAMRWFMQAMQTSGKFSLNLVAKGAAVVLKNIGKFTGSGFLEQIAEFVSEINELFGGWKQRADAVAQALRGDDVAYVLVTTPDPLSVREVLFFAERLRSQGMARDGFVVNRVHPVFGQLSDTEDIRTTLDLRGIELGPNGEERLLQAARDESLQGKIDSLHLLAFESVLETEERGALRVDVPAYPYDIHDIRSLANVADLLAPPG